MEGSSIKRIEEEQYRRLMLAPENRTCINPFLRTRYLVEEEELTHPIVLTSEYMIPFNYGGGLINLPGDGDTVFRYMQDLLNNNPYKYYPSVILTDEVPGGEITVMLYEIFHIDRICDDYVGRNCSRKTYFLLGSYNDHSGAKIRDYRQIQPEGETPVRNVHPKLAEEIKEETAEDEAVSSDESESDDSDDSESYISTDESESDIGESDTTVDIDDI